MLPIPPFRGTRNNHWSILPSFFRVGFSKPKKNTVKVVAQNPWIFDLLDWPAPNKGSRVLQLSLGQAICSYFFHLKCSWNLWNLKQPYSFALNWNPFSTLNRYLLLYRSHFWKNSISDSPFDLSTLHTLHFSISRFVNLACFYAECKRDFEMATMVLKGTGGGPGKKKVKSWDLGELSPNKWLEGGPLPDINGIITAISRVRSPVTHL